MQSLPSLFSKRHEHLLLGAMLLMLHTALWWDFGSALSRSLLLTHLGLFLLWQPVWHGKTRLSGRSLALFLIATVIFLAMVNWWLMAGWTILLLGLVGGRIFTNSHQRRAYLLTLIVLVSELLIRCVPEIFVPTTLQRGLLELFRFGLFLPAVIIMLIPSAPAAERVHYPVDLFRALFIALLASMLAAGSLLNMYHSLIDYPLALFQALVVLSAFLFLLSWLLSPQSGVSGLAQLWDRSLLNIGTPFEQWLGELSSLAEQQQSPDEFLHSAIEYLLDLPWIRGVRWQFREQWHEFGERSMHVIAIEQRLFRVEIQTERPTSTILVLHSHLLIELLHHFHVSKLREQELTTRAHMQAIYETGARVTHDIKNLLQSLHTLTAALQSERGAGEAGVALLQRQLPHIAQRLQSALEKLQSPSLKTGTFALIQLWWQELGKRCEEDAVEFQAHIDNNLPVPIELFDSVIENLLDNARIKRQQDPTVQIRVMLCSDVERLSLSVTDSGPAMEAAIAERIGQVPVASSQGLGVGLYQVAQQAELLGYRLALTANRDGEVSFELSQEFAR